MLWSGSCIVGSSTYLPQRKISNEQALRLSLQTPSAEDSKELEKLTGIVFRRYAEENEAASDLAVKAIRPLLEIPAYSAAKLRAVIVATTSPDYPSPATAHFVHSALGLPQDTVCFDVSSSCSSFLSALRCAVSFLQGAEDQVVVVASEVKNKALGADKRMRALFGDGASAMLICGRKNAHYESSKSVDSAGSCLLDFCYAKTNSALCHHIKIPVGGSREPVNIENIYRNRLVMQEPKMLFRETVKEFAEAIKFCWMKRSEFLQGLGKDPVKTPGWVFVHQANVRILEDLKQRIPDEISLRLPIFMADVGNTVCASLPIVRGRVKAAIGASFVGQNFEHVFLSEGMVSDKFYREFLASSEFLYQADLLARSPDLGVDILVAAGGGFQTLGMLHGYGR